MRISDWSSDVCSSDLAYRAGGAHEIGLVVNIEPKVAASDSAENRAAQRRAEAYMNRQYLDPAIHGRTPPELAAMYGEAWQDWSAEDLALARQRLDFLGVNYYTRGVEIGRASGRGRGCQHG